MSLPACLDDRYLISNLASLVGAILTPDSCATRGKIWTKGHVGLAKINLITQII